MDEERRIDNRVEKIKRAMMQEGMKLTNEESQTIKDIYHGKNTFKDARMQIIQEYKRTLLESKKQNGNNHRR